MNDDTGTDRVELAAHEKELRKLWREVAEKGIEGGVDYPRIVTTLFCDIDALTAERDELDRQAVAEHDRAEGWRKKQVEAVGEVRRLLGVTNEYMAERDAARAELAAANRRCEEEHGPLLRENKTLADELASANARCAQLKRERDLAIAHDTQPYPTAEAYEKVCAARTKWHEKAKALQAEIEVNDQYHDHDIETGVQFMRERDALQETLDRVTALADEWEASEREWWPIVDDFNREFQPSTRLTALRAALTPEGKP